MRVATYTRFQQKTLVDNLDSEGAGKKLAQQLNADEHRKNIECLCVSDHAHDGYSINATKRAQSIYQCMNQ